MTAFPESPELPESVDAVARLMGSLGAEEASLGAVLLDQLGRLNGMVAFKDVSTGRYLYANSRMAALFGRSQDAMVGATDGELFDPTQAAVLRAADQSALATRSGSTAEHRIELAGDRREFMVTRTPIPNPGDVPSTHLCVLWVEMTPLRLREAHLQLLMDQLEQQQAANESLRRERVDPRAADEATGLYGRAHFEDQLRREADLSAREHRQFSLVSIVLDPLAETVRDLGLEGRAKVLEALGRLLRGNTRAMDASCRVEEGRFAILLSGVGLATAHSRMEGLRRQCATQIVAFRGKELGFTVSMGVASFPHTASDQEELLAAADIALSEAIRRGGNQVVLAGIRFEQD